MLTRRGFLKAAAISGAGGLTGDLIGSIRAAFAIEPRPHSTFLDAEHVVILMQENRSFDHAFGTLKGVRGFNDPRAITLPDGNPVWVQATAAGERYVPFRLNIKDTKATWMGSLPHGWTDQTDARNHGRHDRWLPSKPSGQKQYATMPLTLGYYTREDIPFYYSLADAFTICDQYFCSTLTGTTPNRLHLWTGTIRARQSADSPANVRNEDVDFGRWASWSTFPERLEHHGISWKVYQNELSLESGLTEEEDAWLANFSDNPLEWFTQYRVRHAAPHRRFVDKRLGEIPAEIEILRGKLASDSGTPEQTAGLRKRLADLTAALERYRVEKTEWAPAAFDALSPREKNLHARAFSTNAADPDYRRLAEIGYRDGDRERRVKVPSGDVLHQFRSDVAGGTLPTVSWIVAPERFSDHPSSAWYGAWYIAEVLNILTRNPDVWKKTVFILTYDENDGYFDHVPPFTAPHPRRPETGIASKGIDTSLEHLELKDDLKRNPAAEARGGPIGLGYRVPMIIASPWTRGGCVCSQVFDHTSVLQFLEVLLSHRAGKAVKEPNINRWRRTVCGDLTSAFQVASEDGRAIPPFPPRDSFIEDIHKAQFTHLPNGYRVLTDRDVEQIRREPEPSRLLPRQEVGVRRSCPLPYELAVDGGLDAARSTFRMTFEAKTNRFGARSAGAAFIVHAVTAPGLIQVRNYAVEAGDCVDDSWLIAGFDPRRYHLRVYGPNGFFRAFRGNESDPPLDLRLCCVADPSKRGDAATAVVVRATNKDTRSDSTIEVRDNAYGRGVSRRLIPAGREMVLPHGTATSMGWYDLTLHIAGRPQFEWRYAGRVETGNWGITDPVMGRILMPPP
jgi:phospholipase C